MSGVKSVSKHEEASAGVGSFAPQGGSFAPQGGLIARQNLAVCLSIVEPPVSQLVPICHQGGSTKTTGGP